MSESIREQLAREAVEAENEADRQERGEAAPAAGQRGRKRAKDPSQVYAVRIPVSRLRKLREVADRLDVPPTALIRRWVLERLDQLDVLEQETSAAGVATEATPTDVSRLRLGPSRRHAADQVSGDQVRRRA